MHPYTTIAPGVLRRRSLPCPCYRTNGHVHPWPQRNWFSKIDTIQINWRAGQGWCSSTFVRRKACRGASVPTLCSHSMSFQLLAYDHKLNLQWKSLKDIIIQLNETVIYAPTAHKMSENRQFLCPNLVSWKTGRSNHDSEEDGRYGPVLLTVKLHLPWFPSCQQPMCAVHVWFGHRCDCCVAVLISLIGCTLLRHRQTASNGFFGHLSIHQERSDPTGLSDYRALHQSAINAETLPPLCRQPILLAALFLVWEIEPGSRMHENEQSNF